MQLAGCITALVTPFDADGGLDWNAFGRLLDDQLAGGIQGLVVAGSTGEAAMLEGDEYERLIRFARERLGGRVPLLAGTGLSATRATIEQTRRAAAAGADAALVVTPPYVRPTQHGLFEHFRAVAGEGGLPVVLYNVPGRTGCDMQPATVERLREVPGVIGIKEAVSDAERIRAVCALRREGFAVLSGDDPTAVEAMEQGADGLISVVSNALPRLMRSALERRSVAPELRALIDFSGVEPNPIPIKAVVSGLGLVENRLRAPLVELSSPHRAALEALLPRIAAAERSARGGAH
ncbi:4-hydroxy-tetrahydrodipicolinate synthase [Pseudomarimonas salicorniae]|uniref:4-hydroxy-tetrahydrodipicolinate synthase n=1 Tax=Pseudomarimonas salicorniae TaxID=2933270 RepID=A0ABT0GLM4_9GAMM|nr:4-hydroxy-tetrahydrodipicolinate synthase [Lysobacter sp. CAU 1642]MCK7595446.1 4-hydroxy-tetrahydrodipicolinate synthase [Lysobacter sp. CAU 1642]